MIRPEELRVGNALNFEGRVMIVAQINPDNTIRFWKEVETGVTCGPYDLIDHIVQPIPLNEEWLLKLPRIEMYDYILRKSGQGVHIELRGVNITTCDYVHEYQNFYYITQGSELTLKE